MKQYQCKGLPEKRKTLEVLYSYTTKVEHKMCDNTDNYVETIPGKHSLDLPQKIAILGTNTHYGEDCSRRKLEA